MRTFLIFTMFVGTLAFAQAPVIPANQTRTVPASAEVGTTLGAPLFASNSPIAWTIESELNPVSPGVAADEVFFEFDAAGTLVVARPLTPFFGAARAQITVVLTVTAFNDDGQSTETVTVFVANDTPIIPGGQSFSVTYSADPGTEVGTVSSTNTADYFTIVGGNAEGAFSIDSSGLITTASYLDVPYPSANASFDVTLQVAAGNLAGTGATVDVNVTVVFDGTSRCGYIPDTQVVFVSSLAASGEQVGYPIDSHNIDSIWIEDVYVDSNPGFPNGGSDELTTAFTIESPLPTAANFGQIRVVRPLENLVNPDLITRITLTVRGHVIADETTVGCPAFEDSDIIIYILPRDAGDTGPDGGGGTTGGDGDGGGTTTDPNEGPDLSSLIIDDNLRACIRQSLGLAGIQSLTAERILETTHIDCQCSGVSDLEGIHLFTNLTFLSVSNNVIDDISWITGLIQLTDLRLSGNMISDITTGNPLVSLEALRILDLSHNQIVNSNAFSNLLELQYLALEDNNICDITSIVVNSGISDGDTVNLDENYLVNSQAQQDIGELESRGTFVTVFDQKGNCPVAPRFVNLQDWPNENVFTFAELIAQRGVCP